MHIILSFFAESSPTLKVGIKGGDVTLPCHYDGSEIPDIRLISRSENIPVCQTEECSCRVCKKGACDVVIKDLSFSDAGKYILRVYHHNDQTELEPHIRTYQLCVDGKVKTGQIISMLSGFLLVTVLMLHLRDPGFSYR